MCVSDTSRRSGRSVFTGAHGKTPTNRPGATGAPPPGKSLGAGLLSGLVRGYQLTISPWIGPRCRFLPTCSDYALDALAQHGAIKGGWLTVRRLARCHPLGGSGFDPVPATSATPKAYSEAAVHRSASAGAKVPQARA